MANVPAPAPGFNDTEALAAFAATLVSGDVGVFEDNAVYNITETLVFPEGVSLSGTGVVFNLDSHGSASEGALRTASSEGSSDSAQVPWL